MAHVLEFGGTRGGNGVLRAIKPKIGRKEAATKAAAAGQPDIRLGQWRRGNTGP